MSWLFAALRTVAQQAPVNGILQTRTLEWVARPPSTLAQNTWNIYYHRYEWLILCVSIFNMEIKTVKTTLKQVKTGWNNSIQTIKNFQLVEYGRVQDKCEGKEIYPRRLQWVSPGCSLKGWRWPCFIYPRPLCASKEFPHICIFLFLHSLLYIEFNRNWTLGT